MKQHNEWMDSEIVALHVSEYEYVCYAVLWFLVAEAASGVRYELREIRIKLFGFFLHIFFFFCFLFAGLSTRSTSKVTSRAQPLQSLLLLLFTVAMVWGKGFGMWNQQIKRQ